MNLVRLFFTLLAVMIFLTGLSCSDSAAPLTPVTLAVQVVSNAPPPQPGTFVVAKLAGDKLREQTNLLERLRHLPKQTGFQARTFTEAQPPRESLRYLLFKPATTNTAPLPLVLSLHGGGPRGEFAHLLEPYAPGFAYGLGRLTAPETQQAHPSYVVAPWSDNGGWDEGRLRRVLALLDALQTELHYDTNRLYVTGQSMGGFGTWRIIAREPQRFAAAIPICGGSEPATAPRLTRLPIWALHGNADGVVPVSNTRDMITALHRAGAQPIYWEYLEGTHAGTAERAYCEPNLLEWLFAQRRAAKK
jgi:predicted peptidase